MENTMVKPFVPQLVYIEPRALEYSKGQRLLAKFEDMGIEIRETTSHNHIRNLPGDNHFQKYRIDKSPLVVGVRKTLKFDTYKPSEEYAIALSTGYMRHYNHCYLPTQMGCTPSVWTYVKME